MYQLQEDSMHLLNTLIACEGPLTHKLNHFSDYIVRHGTPLVGKVHSNGVHYWWEVQKFKV